MVAFVEAHKQTSHMYPHLFGVHLVTMIKDLPVDPYFNQLQAVENLNQHNKAVQIDATNHQISHNKLISVPASDRKVKGKIVHQPAYERPSGPSRTMQVLSKSLALNILANESITPESNVTEEHTSREKERKSIAKATRVVKALNMNQT